MRSAVVCLAGLLVVLAPGPRAAAEILELTTAEAPFTPGVDNRGWWSPDQPNVDGNDNYAVGIDSSRFRYRAFFTFAVPAAGGRFVRATLEVQRWASLCFGTNRLGSFHVTTDPATLNRNDGISQQIYDDLGAGASYGEFDYACTGAARDFESFELDAGALADLEAARGGYFSVGLAIVDLTAFSGLLFGGSEQAPPTRLLLEVAVDTDGDGVLDEHDACEGTAAADVVDPDGCSLAQLCPCDEPGGENGQRAACVARSLRRFVELGLVEVSGTGAALSGSVQACASPR